jgi:GrpB-like predicted nucleotidyltransferase (UPF0157 family)
MAVTLVEKYNPAWAEWFHTLKQFLGGKINLACISIEHVGSTAIPGMTAKPIIDIDVVIERKDREKMKALLEERGYTCKGDLGIKDRESFDLADETLKATLPAHHLYVTPEDSEELKRHLAFREYLRFHTEERERLSALKMELAARFDNDKYPYMDGKDAMVKEILARALAWYKDKNREH